MAKIIGNPTVTPMAVPDWNQNNPFKADYIKNKPKIKTVVIKEANMREDFINFVTGIIPVGSEVVVNVSGLIPGESYYIEYGATDNGQEPFEAVNFVVDNEGNATLALQITSYLAPDTDVINWVWFAVGDEGGVIELSSPLVVEYENLEDISDVVQQHEAQLVDINANKNDIDSLAYYGDPNIKPSDAKYFEFETNDITMTATARPNSENYLIGELVIPHHYETNNKTYTVTAIDIHLGADGSGAYWGGGITSVIMPDTITTISEECFMGEKKINNIRLSNQLKEIKDYALCNCQQLTEINLPTSLRTIGNEAFQGCLQIKNIIIPDGVTSIGISAFSLGNWKSSARLSITIPKSVVELGGELFLDNAWTDIYFEGTQEQWNSLEEVAPPDYEDDFLVGNPNYSITFGGISKEYAISKEYVDEQIETLETQLGDIEKSLDNIIAKYELGGDV